MNKKNISLLTKDDIYYFKEGSHFNLYGKLGANFIKNGKEEGVLFSLWAPNAKSISVIGDFNNWDKKSSKMVLRGDGSGIWELFIKGVKKGDRYKYFIESNFNNYREEKIDPFAYYFEKPPKSASIVWDLKYEWSDEKWIKEREKRNNLKAPISIYELHLGSWRRDPSNPERFLSYREIADDLIAYLKEMNFTHIEFLPLTEFPFDGSWGYQVIGYFAPTSRFGTPQDFMYLIDRLHQNNIGVILDWVPSHFAVDAHGLAFFDGTNLYEHSDRRQGFHPEWGSAIFNLGRNEVVNFLISSALFWLEKYHIDGLRVDGVASMLYLDYARKEGEWIPNKYGGRENLESIKFLQRLNYNVYTKFPDRIMIAEESTSWPNVTRPTYIGGLGFELKWNMGWMHDTLKYFSTDSIYRKYHQDQLTFSIWYAFNENFLLPLSHDEVVHMKGSLINKMAGDYWQKFANLRALYGYMFSHPGKKLLFMGGEFGQFSEWDFNKSLDWHLLDYPLHNKLKRYFSQLNHLYKKHPALYEIDFRQEGFEWVDINDKEKSIISYLRKTEKEEETILVVCNLTPLIRENYKIGVPYKSFWEEILNSDAEEFGGSNVGNLGGIEAIDEPMHNRAYSLNLTLPPLATLWFKVEFIKNRENKLNSKQFNDIIISKI